MVTSHDTRPRATTSQLMEACLEEGLTAARGAPTSIERLEREPFTGSSSFATERLRAVLADGEQLDVFFKDLNPANQLDEAKHIRLAGLERSRRELMMYRDVLAPLGLGTPILYASRWEPDHDRYWLFLEDAGPKRLSRLGDFNLWVEATRWVARLHTVDVGNLGQRCNFLPHYDAAHFEACGRQLEQNLSRLSAADRPIVLEALDRFRASVPYLRELPTCLVHGEYFGKNVMIRPARPDDAIAVIDWETAAIGPRAIDLVSMTAGRWTREQRHVMCSAYAEMYEQLSGHRVSLDDLYEEMTVVGLYRAVWWLDFWSRGDDAHIARWMKELRTVLGASEVA